MAGAPPLLLWKHNANRNSVAVKKISNFCELRQPSGSHAPTSRSREGQSLFLNTSYTRTGPRAVMIQF